jgi:hypothetical protein
VGGAIGVAPPDEVIAAERTAVAGIGVRRAGGINQRVRRKRILRNARGFAGRSSQPRIQYRARPDEIRRASATHLKVLLFALDKIFAGLAMKPWRWATSVAVRPSGPAFSTCSFQQAVSAASPVHLWPLSCCQT